MPDGEIRWQRWSDRAIFNSSGTLIEYQSVGRGITENIRTEEEPRNLNGEFQAAYEQIAATEEELRQNYNELHEREQKLRESEENSLRIVETAYEAIWVLDSQFRIVQINDRMAEMLGCQPHEVRGRPITDFIPAISPHNQEGYSVIPRKGGSEII